MDVALHGSVVLELVPCLHPWNMQGALSTFLKCSGRAPRLWGRDLVARLGTATISSRSASGLVPSIMASLGRGGVITTIASTKVTDGPGFAAEVGLDHRIASGVLGGDI